jgi:biotin carboxylase
MADRVLMLSPGFPAEMPFFARGLARMGAEVIGVAEGPSEALPAMTRDALAHHLRVRSLWDEQAVVDEVKNFASKVKIDRVECLWEPGMILAARLREALSLPGMGIEQTIPFRDKERMKEVLDAAGLRTPRHSRESSAEGCLEAAERIGYPVVVKPIAGAGSADTHKVSDRSEMEALLPRLRHVPVVSVEEYIDGEEYTYDTICANGEILYENMAWYRPKPIVARNVEWISPQTVTLRDIDKPELQAGRELGRKVLQALGFETGFTHMEWFLTSSGEAVFGEIGGRPPGARSVELMNYGCDIDVFEGWAEAILRGTLSQKIERRYNSAVIFKRAQGEGRITAIEGLDHLLARFGEHIVSVELLPPGTPRRHWRQTLLSDGWIILRHPNLATTLAMADAVGTDLRLYAGG